jgi:4-amino-4-deoxy-L-arabinose transferase-like glycosyltransferase
MSEENSLSVLDKYPFFYSLALIAVALLLFFPGLGRRDFWAPGEPIYGEVIRVMFEKNNWLVPMLNGQLYADKPILYFWLALGVSKLAGGVSEWTARVPTALGGVGLVLVTYQFGKTFFDRRTGFLAGLVLATTSRVFWESRFLRLDTVLSFFLWLGFFCFLKASVGTADKRFFLLGYFCFALATLTKGPIGLLLPGLAILIWVAIAGRWRDIKAMRLITGSILVVAVLAPWLIWLHLRAEDQWIKDFIWIHNVQNYALKPIGHVRPFYYYFYNLPADFLPWTALLPGALIFYYPWRARLREPVNLALLCWFATIFLFFTVSKSKIAYYLLPLLPSLALLIASYLNALLSGQATAGIHWMCTAGLAYLLSVSLLIGGIALPVVIVKVDPTLFGWMLPITLLLIAGSTSMVVFLRWKIAHWVLWSFMILFVAVSVVSSIGVLPSLDRYKSPRPIGEFVLSHVPASTPVYVFHSTMSDFNYYARREKIPVIASEEIPKLRQANSALYILINDKDLHDVKQNYDIVTAQPVGERKWFLLRISRMVS